MDSLSHTDLLALNCAIGEIYAVRDLESFYQSLFTVIQSIIPCEYCSINDIDLKTNLFLKVIASSQDRDSVIKKNFPVLNAHCHEHPLFPKCYSGDVIKITDFASINEFKGMAIYNEYYRNLDIETQITFAIPLTRGKISLFAVSRKNSDFSERDRLILTLLRPHLIISLRNVTELGHIRLENDLLKRGAETKRQGVLMLHQDGTVITISELAGEMLDTYFAAPLAEGDQLPPALVQWIESETCLSQLVQQVERAPFVVEKNGKRLTIELRHDFTTCGRILVCSESDPATKLRRLHQYELSSRQIETLLWLAKGKTNAEIAVILNISRRTVEKHLEHIFAKLGVETRAAASAIVKKCDIN